MNYTNIVLAVMLSSILLLLGVILYQHVEIMADGRVMGEGIQKLLDSHGLK